MLLAFGLSCAEESTEATRDPRPNIVLIVGDDHGYEDFGFMGSEAVITPNLDRLAAEGTVFPTVYVTGSLCRPSLLSLLNGLHPEQWASRLRILRSMGTAHPEDKLLENSETLPRLLERNGYRSFQAGKLHASRFELAGFGEGLQEPGDRPDLGGTGRRIGRGVSLDPVYGFIDRNDPRPFFLWFAPMLPHSPYDAPERLRRPYLELGLTEGAVRYYANITRFDELVGELLAHLEARELREHTLVVYLADNGWETPRKGTQVRTFEAHARGKGTMHEMGFRTPLVLRWPGRIPAAAVRSELVSSVDLFPTLADYAGVVAPEDLPGHSLRPLLEGRGEWRRSRLMGSMEHVRANRYRPKHLAQLRDEYAYFLRDSRWHYIWYEDWGSDALYDIEKDPLELEDVAEANPLVVKRSRRLIGRWRREMRQRPMQ